MAARPVNTPPTVKILALMETASLSGRARNLVGFGRWLRSREGARTGLSVAIATFDRNARTHECDSFVGFARAAGIETHVIRERHRFDLAVRSQLRQITSDVNPDIIQTHNNKSHLLLRLLPASRARRLWFAFHHGDTYPDFKQRVYNHVDGVTLRAADRVVTVCEAFRPRLIACGVSPDRVRILHNAASPAPPVSQSERAQLRERLGVRCGEAVILSIGRLSREKGHADLLGALGQLRSLEREWKLVLVGAGPDRVALEQLARARCIAARVRFAGFHTDVSPFYAIADVVVLPSHSEGSSNVLLETMMAGVPIVATTAGGIPEMVVDGQTGLLAGVGDLAGLAAAIRRLLRQQELVARLVAAAGARARHEFSQDRYRRLLLGFYAEALGTAGAAAEYRSPVGARPWRIS